VRLLTSIKKTTFNLKYLHTKNGGSILVPVECVVSPIYRFMYLETKIFWQS
jgi:CRISPR-associated protein Cas5h